MKAEKDKIVAIEFTLKDVENTILDTNVGYAPIDYLHGVGTLVSGLEKELEGKQIGETITIELSPKRRLRKLSRGIETNSTHCGIPSFDNY